MPCGEILWDYNVMQGALTCFCPLPATFLFISSIPVAWGTCFTPFLATIPLILWFLVAPDNELTRKSRSRCSRLASASPNYNGMIRNVGSRCSQLTQTPSSGNYSLHFFHSRCSFSLIASFPDNNFSKTNASRCLWQ